MRTSITKDASFDAWAGTAEELHLLLTHLRAAFADEEKAARGKLDARSAGEVTESGSREGADRLGDYERRRVDNLYTERASVTDRRTDAEHSGTLAEVLSAIPERDIAKLYLRYPGHGAERSATLFFHRNGVRLTIDADEPVWANAMRDATSSELKRCRPWWSFLFKTWGSLLLYILLLATFTLVSQAVIARADLEPSSSVQLLITASCALIALALSNVATLGVLLPRFEVLSQGGSPTGTRRVGWLLTAIIGALLGTFVQYLFG